MSQKDWIEKDFYKTLGVPKDAERSEASDEDAEGAVDPVAVATEGDAAEAAPAEEAT